MAAKRVTTSETLRAWADALNAVADLQDAIVEQMHEYTMIDDWHWVESYRDIVRAALGRIQDSNIEAAQDMKIGALQALETFKEEAKQHPGRRNA